MLDLPADTLREFERELLRYWAHTQKDLAYVVNRQALNVAIKAGQQTPLADKQDILDLPRHEWWPKFVAKKLKSARGVRLKGRKGKRGRIIQRNYTIPDARKASKQLVRNRLKRVGYIRSGWAGVIKSLALQKWIAKVRTIPGTRGFKKPEGYAIGARPGPSPVALIVNEAKGAPIVGTSALARAIGLAAADMRQYINERMGGTAKKYNR